MKDLGRKYCVFPPQVLAAGRLSVVAGPPCLNIYR
jgi:hypothetical protein